MFTNFFYKTFERLSAASDNTANVEEEMKEMSMMSSQLLT